MIFKIHLITWSVIIALVGLSPLNGGTIITWGGNGNTVATDVALDGSSNIYVVGGFTGTIDCDPGITTNNHASKGIRDAFLTKFGSDGTWRWSHTWGGSNDDRANSVVVYGTNVYVAGCFQDTVDFNPSGGDTHTASRNTNGFPDNDAFLCKFDSNGNFKWAKTWGGNGGDEAYNCDVDRVGNVYVAGDFGSTNINLNPIGGTGNLINNGRWDAFLLKFDADGSNIWARNWGGIYYDDCTCVAVDAAGNVYGGGMFASPVADFDPGPGTNYLYANNPIADWGLVDVFLTKFDSNGNFQWAKSWGESNHWDAAQGVAVDLFSNVYVSGYFADTVDFNPNGAASNITSHGGDDAFLCKYDSAGEFKWVTTWGGTSNDYARGVAVDGFGYVYVAGDYMSTNMDFNPGVGVENHSTFGGKDISIGKFDCNGKFVLARTCGGVADDAGFGGVIVDGSGNAFLAGKFVGQVDFGSLIGGTTNPPFYGAIDSFLAQIPTCIKITVTKTGNGYSSLGVVSPALQLVSLGIMTQIVYTATDWHRILALDSNGITLDMAAGAKIFTQALVNIAIDQSNDVTFALATPTQTGYTNVPTVWLTNWTENGIITDTAFDVHAKYLIGLDPTTSNTFDIRIESFIVSETNVVTVIKRTYTGGLAPEGMHGNLALQSTDNPDSMFTNMAGTLATGANVFDGAGRKTYTNGIEATNRFFKAVIQ